MFDLCETHTIKQNEITMMLTNLPDMGFVNSQNVSTSDKMY